MGEFDFLENEREKIPEDIKIYVKKSMDILEYLHEVIESKNITQRQLADKLGKSEAEVSRWLNGVQNFTIRTLSKLEAALGTPIIVVPNKKPKGLLVSYIFESETKQQSNSNNFEFKIPSGAKQKDELAA